MHRANDPVASLLVSEYHQYLFKKYNTTDLNKVNSLANTTDKLRLGLLQSSNHSSGVFEFCFAL